MAMPEHGLTTWWRNIEIFNPNIIRNENFQSSGSRLHGPALHRVSRVETDQSNHMVMVVDYRASVGAGSTRHPNLGHQYRGLSFQ